MRTYPALDLRFPEAHREQDQLAETIEGAILDCPITALDQGDALAPPRLWRAYFPDSGTRDDAAATLARLCAGTGVTIDAVEVADEDWAARSQAGLGAVRAGRFVIAPPWAVPDRSAGTPRAGSVAQPATTLIVIQPSMGFGTGHHATTRLCCAALDAIDLRGARVLDVGTGSGVLAIAASRLGAVAVLGIDVDEDSMLAARASLALNPGADVTLAVMDVRQATLSPFDLVVANLTGALLIAATDALQRLSRHRLILSGFLSEEREDVIRAYAGWAIEREAQEDGWGVVTLAAGIR
ncbi:MAG: methyltransferase domain-containing protein [Acidimicrobiia bacterium]|nr:methyltransferase domain-containing protein [Acidimicrobiia bacterium]